MKNQMTDFINVSILEEVAVMRDVPAVMSWEKEPEKYPDIDKAYKYRARMELYFDKVAPAYSQDYVKQEAIKSLSHFIYKDVIAEIVDIADKSRRGDDVTTRLFEMADTLSGRCR